MRFELKKNKKQKEWFIATLFDRTEEDEVETIVAKFELYLSQPECIIHKFDAISYEYKTKMLKFVELLCSSNYINKISSTLILEADFQIQSSFLVSNHFLQKGFHYDQILFKTVYLFEKIISIKNPWIDYQIKKGLFTYVECIKNIPDGYRIPNEYDILYLKDNYKNKDTNGFNVINSDGESILIQENKEHEIEFILNGCIFKYTTMAEGSHLYQRQRAYYWMKPKFENSNFRQVFFVSNEAQSNVEIATNSQVNCIYLKN